MAELTITVRQIAGRTRVAIRVGYRSDADALPHEHEEQHRRLVRQLFPSLVMTDDRDAAVRVRRERPAVEPVVG
jgi:hypothetical protein